MVRLPTQRCNFGTSDDLKTDSEPAAYDKTFVYSAFPCNGVISGRCDKLSSAGLSQGNFSGVLSHIFNGRHLGLVKSNRSFYVFADSTKITGLIDCFFK